MVKKLITMLAVLLVMAPMAGAVEVHGVIMPDKLTVAGETLVLNGAGLREKYFVGVDVYVAGLYLKEPSTDADAITSADETMALRIEIVTGLMDSEKFTEATITGFEESTDGNTEPIQEETDLFLTAFAGEINKGDVFDIQYIKGVGTKVFKNGRDEPEVVVPGYKVKKALFGIWLADRTEKHLQVLAKDLLGKE